MPGGQYEPQLRRGPHQKQLQLLQRLRAQFVHVVDHQPQPVLQRSQVRQQPLGDGPPVQVRGRRQRLHQLRTRAGTAQRSQDRQPEPLRILLIARRRHPRGVLRRARPDPRPQQHRLAAARRRGHHRHPGRPCQPLEQPGAGNHPARTGTSEPPGNGTRLARSHTRIIPDPRSVRISRPAANALQPLAAARTRPGNHGSVRDNPARRAGDLPQLGAADQPTACRSGQAIGRNHTNCATVWSPQGAWAGNHTTGMITWHCRQSL